MPGHRPYDHRLYRPWPADCTVCTYPRELDCDLSDPVELSELLSELSDTSYEVQSVRIPSIAPVTVAT
jgi:hypothetical protein